MGHSPFVSQDDPGFFNLPEIPEEFLGETLFLFQEDVSVFGEALLLPVGLRGQVFPETISIFEMEWACRVSFQMPDADFYPWRSFEEFN